MVLGATEMLIVLALGITGFANPGPGGVSLGVFNFGNKIALSGFALAVVLSVQGLTGWEAAAPLAEETRDPKRNVPRSVIISIILLGCFLVFTFWGVITGFGVDTVNRLINSPVLPGLALGVGFVYVIANIGVIRYYLTERRSEFNFFKHIAFPVISAGVLLYAVAISFQPFCTTVCPASPYS